MDARQVIAQVPQWCIDLLQKSPRDGHMLCLVCRGDNVVGRLLINCKDLSTLRQTEKLGCIYRGLSYNVPEMSLISYIPFSCDTCKQHKPAGWNFYDQQGQSISICEGCVFVH